MTLRWTNDISNKKHKHHYCSLSDLAQYVVQVVMGLRYKIEVFTHNNKLPDNYWYAISKQSRPMLQDHSIKKIQYSGGLILVLIRTRPFENVVSQEWEGRLTWNERMWVDKMLYPHCDFELWHHPWPWPLIFHVKFWKCCISGMRGPIDMERKGCKSIGC